MNSSGQYEPTLSVVVPAYNEEETIAHVIARLLLVPSLLEIIVVDDASKDRTFSVVQALQATTPQVRLLRHTHVELRPLRHDIDVRVLAQVAR